MRLLSFFLLISCQALLAQVPYFNIQFDYNHKWEGVTDVIEADSNYVIVGGTGAPFQNDTGLIITVRKSDLTFGTHKLDYFTGTKMRAIAPAPDKSGIILHSRYFIGSQMPANENMFLAKLNSSLDTVAFKTYGLPNIAEYTLDMNVGSDGSISLTGYTYQGQTTPSEIILFKCDSSLHQIFFKTYTKNLLRNHFGTGLTDTPDKGLIVVGNRYPDSEHSAGIIFKVDSLGNQVWWKDIFRQGVEKHLFLQDIVRKEDGTYLVVGEKVFDPIVGTDYQQYWLLNLDENGEILWSKEYGYNDWTGWNRIARCSDGNYAMCGYEKDEYANGNTHKQYGVISKVTPSGNLLWHRKYTMSTENKRYDVFNGFTPTSDGGFICVGTVWGDNTSRENAWVVKLDSLGCLEPGCDPSVSVIELPVGEASPITIYPNPTDGLFTVEAREGQRIGHVRVYDAQGRTVLEKQVEMSGQVPLDLSAAPPGGYFCAVLVGGVWVVRQVSIR